MALGNNSAKSEVESRGVVTENTADAVLTGGAEKALTEMSDAELLDFIRLDLPVAARL